MPDSPTAAEPPTRFAFRPPPPHEEPTPRWVRVQLAGQTVADSQRARLLIEYGPGRLPTYFFPTDDVRFDLLTNPREEDGRRIWDVQVPDRVAGRAAWAYVEPPDALAGLADHVTFVWHRMDAWFEEDEQVFVHARDPYKRVDVLGSSRRVEVLVDGEAIADSRHPHLLFETGLPIRYYLPSEDVRMHLLEPSDTVTQCPYKGIARYWSVQVGDTRVPDAAWSYPDPIPENPRIKGLICFFNEKVDLRIDGVVQPRPVTPWS